MKTELKKWVCLLATLMLICFLPVTALAQNETAGIPANAVEADFQVEDDLTGVRIVKYLGSGGDVTVPSTLNGKAVVSIGEYAFSHCISLKSIVLPEGVLSIGSGLLGMHWTEKHRDATKA